MNTDKKMKQPTRSKTEAPWSPSVAETVIKDQFLKIGVHLAYLDPLLQNAKTLRERHQLLNKMEGVWRPVSSSRTFSRKLNLKARKRILNRKRRGLPWIWITGMGIGTITYYTCPECGRHSAEMTPLPDRIVPPGANEGAFPDLLHERLLCPCGLEHTWDTLKPNIARLKPKA